MAMKLKSGADLCGFELLNFCIQGEPSIPDAPAVGRKYLHTGTGDEGSYLLNNRERIYVGSNKWRAAAYVDDLANLDVASNEDFKALQDKVALLAGDVDTDAIINNMKEVAAFLEGYGETENLMGLLNGKLDTKGGTITGNLIVNKTITATALRLHESDGTYVGQITGDLSNVDTVYFANRNGSFKTLLHSGNIGDYAFVPRTTVTNNTDANTLLANGVYTNSTGNGSGNVNFPHGYGIFMSFAKNDNYIAQIALSTSSMCARIKFGSSGWKDWKTIAFTDSDITGYAAGLKHSNGTVGATADTNGKILLSGYGIAATNGNWQLSTAGYNGDFGTTNSSGVELYSLNGVLLSVGKKGLILNSSGNVGIGNDNPQAKLHVAGDLIVDGQISAGGSADAGSTAGGSGKKWSTTFSAANSATQTFTHNLAETDVIVNLYEKDSNNGRWNQILADISLIGENQVSVTFGSTQPSNTEFMIVVMG